MIDTNKIREDVGGPRARDPDNETIHALCDEIDRLRTTIEPLDGADAAYVVGALRIERETLAKVAAERDQLRAEMAEARKTVDALGRQVAALRDALLGVRRALSDWSAPAVDAVLRDTAAVATGFYSEAEVSDALDSVLPLLARDCIPLFFARLKQARSA